MSSPALLKDDQIVAGPWHRAFGFLVRSGIHQEKIASYLPRRGAVAKISLRAPYREIPLVRGYKNQGLRSIEERTGASVIGLVADETVPSEQVGVDIL